MKSLHQLVDAGDWPFLVQTPETYLLQSQTDFKSGL